MKKIMTEKDYLELNGLETIVKMLNKDFNREPSGDTLNALLYILKKNSQKKELLTSLLHLVSEKVISKLIDYANNLQEVAMANKLEQYLTLLNEKGL